MGMPSWRWCVAVVVLVMGFSCMPEGHPTLDVTLSQRNTVGAESLVVRVVATSTDGKVGTGSVTIESSAGSLTTPVDVQLDAYGTARAELICDPTAEAGCATAVRITASWSTPKEVVTAEAVLNSSSVGGSTGGSTGTTGGGSGAGGGSGVGGGSGAGGGSGTHPPFCPSTTSTSREFPNGCCRRPNTPGPGLPCDSIIVSDGQTIMRTFIDAATGDNIQVPLRFRVPTVTSVDSCKAAIFGFEIDFSVLDAGLLTSTTSCGGGTISDTNMWQFTGGGGCGTRLLGWAHFNCDDVYDPAKNLSGSFQMLEYTATPPFSNVYAGGRTFLLKDAGVGTDERYVFVMKQ